MYSLRVSMIGYRTESIPKVKVTVDDTASVIVHLEETPIEIDPVVVTASRWQQEADNTSAMVEVLFASKTL